MLVLTMFSSLRDSIWRYCCLILFQQEPQSALARRVRRERTPTPLVCSPPPPLPKPLYLFVGAWERFQLLRVEPVGIDGTVSCVNRVRDTSRTGQLTLQAFAVVVLRWRPEGLSLFVVGFSSPCRRFRGLGPLPTD